MAQERVQRQKQTAAQETADVDSVAVETNEELAADVENTLDSIDDVLEDFADEDLLSDLDGLLGTEEEAQQLVAEFVQQGGE